MEQQYLSGSGEASSPAARTLRSSISTGRLQLHSGSPSHASMSPIKRPATGKPKQPGVELVDQESKPVTPPRLFDYAMGLGTAAAAAVPVLSLPQYERKYGSLLDYGDPAAPLRDVVRTTLFSPEPFWDHLSAKYKENYSYLTGIERTFRWAAGVALEYVSHKFVPVERELIALRVALEKERQATNDSEARVVAEMDKAKQFRAEIPPLHLEIQSLKKELREVTSRANALIETVRIDANQAITEAKVEMENLKEQMVQAREGKLAAESKLEDAIVELAHEQEKCKEAVRLEKLSSLEAWRGRDVALDELRLAIQSARQHQEVRYKTVKERDYAREQAQEYSRMLRHARKQLELAGQRRRQDAAAVLRSAAIGSGGPSGPTASLPSSKPLTTISDQQLLPPLATSDASTSFSRGSFKS